MDSDGRGHSRFYFEHLGDAGKKQVASLSFCREEMPPLANNSGIQFVWKCGHTSAKVSSHLILAALARNVKCTDS